MSAVEYRVLPGAGSTIGYAVGGRIDGRPLVLLHGLSADSTSWSPVMDRFAPAWRMHALDFRGHGRSDRTPGRYRLDDYMADADRLLLVIGEPAVVVGHSLGAMVASALAQDRHPLVRAVFLEDPPLYLVQPGVFATSSFSRAFSVLADHVGRLQRQGAPVQAYYDLLAASPHPAGDRLGDHLYEDALWSRAGALSRTDPAAIRAVLDGTTFDRYDPARRLHCPTLVVSADEAYDPAFRPGDDARLQLTTPHAAIITMPGAAHNIRGDRAAREGYLTVLGGFLTHRPAVALQLR